MCRDVPRPFLVVSIKLQFIIQHVLFFLMVESDPFAATSDVISKMCIPA